MCCLILCSFCFLTCYLWKLGLDSSALSTRHRFFPPWLPIIISQCVALLLQDVAWNGALLAYALAFVGLPHILLCSILSFDLLGSLSSPSSHPGWVQTSHEGWERQCHLITFLWLVNTNKLETAWIKTKVIVKTNTVLILLLHSAMYEYQIHNV